MENMSTILSQDQLLLKYLLFFSQNRHASFQTSLLTFEQYYHDHGSHKDAVKRTSKKSASSFFDLKLGFFIIRFKDRRLIKNIFPRHQGKLAKPIFLIRMLIVSIFFKQTCQSLCSDSLPRKYHLCATFSDIFCLSGGLGNSNPEKNCDKLDNLHARHDQKTAIFTQNVFFGIKCEKVRIEHERVTKCQF